MLEQESRTTQPPERFPELGDHPIPTNWVTKADLAYCRPNLADKIRRLDVSDMQEIAGKVGDALQETYWIAVGVILDEYLKEEHERSDQH